MIKGFSVVVVAILTLVFPLDSKAQSYGYSFFSSVGYSDNLAQLPVLGGGQETESGTVTTAGVEFNFQSDPNVEFVTSIDGAYARNWYSLDELTSDDQRTLNLSGVYQPDDTNFRLGVFDSYLQVALDRESAQTVNNLRDINVFSVVPSYFILISPVSRINTEYRFSSIRDKEGVTSRDFDIFTLGYERQVNSYLSLLVNARKQNTELSDTDQEFKQEEGFVGISGRGGITNFVLEYGRQRILNDGGVNDAYQSSARFSLIRQINSFSSLTAGYSQGFGDALTVDLDNTLVNVSANDQAGFSDGIVVEKALNFRYTYVKRNLLLDVNVGARTIKSDEDVQGNQGLFDEERTFFNFSLSDRFSNTGGVSAFGYQVRYFYSEDEFNLTDQTQDTGSLALRLTYFASLNFETYIELNSRDASGEAANNNFDERGGRIGFVYTPLIRN
ncbi:hypothetical protein NBRC116494_16540 [Aurantivibrio plasticivorans]